MKKKKICGREKEKLLLDHVEECVQFLLQLGRAVKIKEPVVVHPFLDKGDRSDLDDGALFGKVLEVGWRGLQSNMFL